VGRGRRGLKSFAHLAVAAQVGCGWCLDVSYFQAHNQNLDVAKASEVPRWRESDVFTPLERDVLDYAETMTNTPSAVTDELSACLLDRLGPAAMVEFTVFIAFSNMATRSNTALGIESQGFSERYSFFGKCSTCRIARSAKRSGSPPRR
jgi:AhpD family alkylhydroperoxidase